MTPSNATLTTSTSTIMKHTAPESEGAKKSRFSPSYYDVYSGNPPPTSGQMMMSSAYSPGPGTYHPHPHHQTTTSNAFSQYPSNATSTYPNYPTAAGPGGATTATATGNGHHHHHQQATAVLNGPPTPQFVQSTSLGPPSPAAALASPFSTPQFTNATPAQAAAAAAAAAAVYTHHMPSPQLSSASHQTARTVYVGNIPSETQVSEIMDHVKVGHVDSIRPLPEKNCVFITFVDAAAAAQFYHETTTTKKLTVNGTELRVGWGRPSSIPTQIHVALQNGASRNVFLGSLDDTVTEHYLNETLSRFGPIEHTKLIKDKNIAFVHFLSTSSAIKCVASLPNEKDWSSRRVNYGRDRCAPSSKSSSSNSSSTTTQNTPAANSTPATFMHHPHHPSAAAHHPAHHPHHHQVFPTSSTYPNTFQVRFPSTVSYDPYTGAAVETYPASPITANVAAAAAAAVAAAGGQGQAGGNPGSATSLMGSVANRTIYLGNIHPDTTCEEICNVIRGGILSQIRYLSDKHIAFVTFVDPALALHFYNQALYHGLVIKNRRLKIGWGKASALSPSVLSAVQNGGSRNVYLGNIDETITEEKLKQDFSDYGEIELVNTLKEKNCAFVNFTSIAAAVRAIEGIRSKEEYKKFRINYGKDRCGNPPRMQQGGNGRQHHHSHQRSGSTSGGSTGVDPALLTPSSVTVDPKNDQQVIPQDAVIVEQQQQQQQSSEPSPVTQDSVVPNVDTVNGVLESVLVPNGSSI
ncbi:hypothetical protein BDA99DRAFT_560776 [Phascolomyces articulosus]|uniref:RRM domain-containing protein n=1 Tax=Phascolomyces articulosus TaxID=60185 RepID=A0AAD5JYK4_9FUNG|nr:hypothetical protein BDA99DRAFT_560776 [Phascolomyces articulosus]